MRIALAVALTFLVLPHAWAETDTEKIGRLEAEVARLKADVARLQEVVARSAAMITLLRLDVAELGGKRNNPATVQTPTVEDKAATALKSSTKTIAEITNGSQYVKLSDGTLWNFYSDSRIVQKWKVGDAVEKLGAPEYGFQKFKGPDGNIGKATEEK